MLVYLDNCCFNRPYDDQSYMSVYLETQAKLYIQELIRCGKIEMATSYVLEYENSRNPFEMRKTTILDFINEYETVYVSASKHKEIESMAEKIKKTGIKHKDACHVSCAILAGCQYFLSTDYRLLKYETDKITMINPIDFVKELEAD